MIEGFRFKDPLDAVFSVAAGSAVVVLEAAFGYGGWGCAAFVVYRFYRACRVPAATSVDQEVWPLILWLALPVPMMMVVAVIGLETGIGQVAVALHFILETVETLPLGALLMRWAATQHRLEGVGELLDYFAAINLLVSAIGLCSVVIWLGFYLPQLAGRQFGFKSAFYGLVGTLLAGVFLPLPGLVLILPGKWNYLSLPVMNYAMVMVFLMFFMALVRSLFAILGRMTPLRW